MRIDNPALTTPVSGDASNMTNAVAYALKSATTSVDVSAAAAPAIGKVLTATDSTHATWQTPAAGGGGVGSTLYAYTLLGGL